MPRNANPIQTCARRTVALALVALVALTGCSGDDHDHAEGVPTAADAPACPVEPVEVAVTAPPWVPVVSALTGRCAHVHAVGGGGSGDPHDHESTPGDQAGIAGARVVVTNGLGVDRWAEGAAADGAIVVDAGKVTNRRDGDNPHLWYAADDIAAVAGAVTSALGQAAPDARAYFDERQQALLEASKPYTALVDEVARRHGGKRVAATEGVADLLFVDLGLQLVTPEGYARAMANESEPAPGDVAAFRTLLTERRADVLLVNAQTEGAVPDQLRAAAEAAGVPVVVVTESAPEGTGFFDWHVDQLRHIDRALSGTS